MIAGGSPVAVSDATYRFMSFSFHGASVHDACPDQ